ncbi:DUF427 domain-containing protein [Halomonas sp. TRM85114]|uniref:DUF427 domain-containing protein n=1 Tax=Halomonas jincaotanensis TaxID=2810616 RepID=UPI001BD48783|nr:DUF427 domain-containing protein [Halomonas jincaotanensis]MBS9405687.1 DUF427 domain-containing protein [Halomonas jincaotanensis]
MMTDPTEPRLTRHRGAEDHGGHPVHRSQLRCALRESGYPTRQYIPRGDERMDLLVPPEIVTHCPFHGDATFFSFGDMADVAWNYEEPVEEMKATEGRLALISGIVSDSYRPKADMSENALCAFK